MDNQIRKYGRPLHAIFLPLCIGAAITWPHVLATDLKAHAQEVNETLPISRKCPQDNDGKLELNGLAANGTKRTVVGEQLTSEHPELHVITRDPTGYEVTMNYKLDNNFIIQSPALFKGQDALIKQFVTNCSGSKEEQTRMDELLAHNNEQVKANTPAVSTTPEEPVNKVNEGYEKAN